MKKHIVTIFIMMMTILVSACTNSDIKSPNSISTSTFTDREQVLVAATSDKAFVFDFNIDDTYKEVSVWVDKYEFGKKVETPIPHISVDVKDKGMIIFTTLGTNNENESIFNVTINSDDAMSTSNNAETISNKGLENMASLWESNPLEKNTITDEMVLASILYSEGKGISSLSSDFYNDLNNHIQELKSIDIVYLLRAEFK